MPFTQRVFLVVTLATIGLCTRTYMFPTDIMLTEFAFWGCLETAGLYILRYITSNEFCFCSFFGFSGSRFDMLELFGEVQECLRCNALFLPKTELQSSNGQFHDILCLIINSCLLASPAFTWSLRSLISTSGSCHWRWDEVANAAHKLSRVARFSMADTYKTDRKTKTNTFTSKPPLGLESSISVTFRSLPCGRKARGNPHNTRSTWASHTERTWLSCETNLDVRCRCKPQHHPGVLL